MTTQFQKMTVKELIALCRENNITGYSNSLCKGKSELVAFIHEKYVESEAANAFVEEWVKAYPWCFDSEVGDVERQVSKVTALKRDDAEGRWT
ncbi:Rho termination factor N-terminal domain-containing protein [Ancylothrix sp. C2]|uniref:Rho termination factor N-terminal domain-containing protein n=1 Tax=Ancylothrix sp. D3o TaxID=2953691 RepID=UPI0021BAC9C8|nr:Rho termination factor N-terminal domain-containing protein [Ancylothrix sp. D3o]MCT7953594.1 Rho termination factor N-terminal domain-containing protein [Ancylothrix sp. D3o]